MALADKQISKIKMVGLTPHSYKNIVWYSPIKENKKDNSTIVDGMVRRFLNHRDSKFVKVIQFYSTQTNTLIKELKRN